MTNPWEEEFAAEFEICERLLGFAKQLPVRLAHPKTEYESLLLGFFAKILNGLDAIVVLCRQGRAVTALPLLRVMFEDSINLSYISAAPDERATRYLEYSWVEKKLMLDDLRAAGYQNYEQDLEKAKEAPWWKEYQRVKANYPFELSWEHYVDEDQKQKALKPFEMAKHVKATEPYRLIYPYASRVAHCTATGLSMYLTPEDSAKGATLDLDPSGKEINSLLGPAFALGILVVKEAISVSSPAFLPQAQALDKEGQKIFIGEEGKKS